MINTARGALVDEKALEDALSSGQLSGAGLDTFAEEPLRAFSPLLQMEQIILTPHVAASTQGALEKTYSQAIHTASKYLFDGICDNNVNPDYFKT